MNPWYVLVGLGAVLVLSGIVAVFRVKTSGANTAKFLGVEISSNTPGGFMVALGVACLFFGLMNGSKTQTLVTDVRLMTDTDQASAEYNVRCPINVALKGSIAVSGDPGTVSYELDRQDGFNGPISKGVVHTLAFNEAGSQSIPFNIPVTIPDGDVNFTATLAVIAPTTQSSDPVQVSVHCDSTLPPGPPTPPPNVSAPPG